MQKLPACIREFFISCYADGLFRNNKIATVNTLYIIQFTIYMANTQIVLN